MASVPIPAMFGTVPLAFAVLFALSPASPPQKRSISSLILNVEPFFIIWYAFATNDNSICVPVATSSDFDIWDVV